MKDNRSLKIKKVLQQKYPANRFNVRIKKWNTGEAIYVYTDLMPPMPWQLKPNDPKRLSRKYEIATVRLEIEKQLKSFWHVDRCEFSNEILGGGNTYLHVLHLE